MTSNKRIRTDAEMNAEREARENQRALIMTDLYKTRDDNKTGMVALHCKDGLINAHKLVLLSGSDYFRVIFSPGSNEDKNNMVALEDTSIKVMNIVIKFIYAQDISDEPDNMPESSIYDLILTADKMQLKDLFDKYWTLLSTQITLDNFLKIWQLAEMFNRDETINCVHQFTLMNVNQISESGKLCKITMKHLESFIDNLNPYNIGDYMLLILNWEKETKIEGVLQKLILPRGNFIMKMPDSALQSLLSTEAVATAAPIFSVLSKEASDRWLTIKSQLQIFVFGLNRSRCEHKVLHLNELTWLPRVERLLNPQDGETLGKFYSAVSKTGNVFYFKRLPNNSGIAAIEGSTGESFNLLDDVITPEVELWSETSNSIEIFFLRTRVSYWCFNFVLKTWHTLDFGNQIYDCCIMLLATEDGKYFFDVFDYIDGGQIKIVDIKMGTCVNKKKLDGNWDLVKCKSFDGISEKKLIFVDRHLFELFLIYHIDYDCWSVISLPDIDYQVKSYVSYDSDCLLFEEIQADDEDSTGIYKCNMYSLKKRMKVAEYQSENVYDFFYFDASYKM